MQGERFSEDLRQLAGEAWEVAGRLCGACRNLHVLWPYQRLAGSPGRDVAVVEPALRRLLSASGRKVLIAGCADSGLLALVARTANPATAITVVDRCETPLELCRRFARRWDFTVDTDHLDLTELSATSSFDVVFAHELLQHIPADRRVDTLGRKARRDYRLRARTGCRSTAIWAISAAAHTAPAPRICFGAIRDKAFSASMAVLPVGTRTAASGFRRSPAKGRCIGEDGRWKALPASSSAIQSIHHGYSAERPSMVSAGHNDHEHILPGFRRPNAILRRHQRGVLHHGQLERVCRPPLPRRKERSCLRQRNCSAARSRHRGLSVLRGARWRGQFPRNLGGLKFYFGRADKPLIARHRQDDPPNWTTDTLFSITNNNTGSTSTTSSQFCPPGEPLVGGECQTPR